MSTSPLNSPSQQTNRTPEPFNGGGPTFQQGGGGGQATLPDMDNLSINENGQPSGDIINADNLGLPTNNSNTGPQRALVSHSAPTSFAERRNVNLRLVPSSNHAAANTSNRPIVSVPNDSASNERRFVPPPGFHLVSQADHAYLVQKRAEDSLNAAASTPKSYRKSGRTTPVMPVEHEYRPTRQPEWKDPLFKVDDDWRAHMELIQRALQKHPRLTPHQKSQLVLDSISRKLHPHALRTDSSSNLPTVEVIFDRMKQLDDPCLETETIDWLADFRKLEQKESENLVDFTGRVMQMIRNYKDSSQFTEKDYAQIEHQALLTLSYGIRDVYKVKLDKVKKSWKEGIKKPNPNSDFDSVYTTLLDFAKQDRKDRNKNVSAPQKIKDCRFGVNCTRQGCKFKHPEGRTVPKPKQKRKRDDSDEDQRKKLTTCAFCKRPGHDETVCWKKNGKPEKKE